MQMCPHCGASNDSANAFCERCGGRLAPEAAVKTLEDPSDTPRVDPDVAPHVLVTANDDAPPPRGGLAARVQPPHTPEESGLVLTFPGGETFTARTTVVNVGRADLSEGWRPELDVTPYGGGSLDLGVSRHHARIEHHDGSFVVIDLASTNGTYVNGHVVPSEEPTPLTDGDSLAFGALMTVVSIAMARDRSNEEQG